MSVEFDEFISAGVDLGCFGTLRTDGYLRGGGAADPAAGNVVGSGMVRVRGVTNASPNVPAPDVVNIPGDGISQGTFQFQSTANPAFDLDKTVFDLVTDAVVQQTKVYVMGGAHLGILKPNTNSLEDISMILQAMTKKKDQGLGGLKAWSGYWIPICSASPEGRQAFADRAGAADRWRVITTPADQLFNGIAIDKTNFGTAGGCIVPFTNDWPLMGWRWTGNGVVTAFTLPVYPGEYSADQVIVTVNGVLQVYTTAYTAAGLVLTFVAAPASNAKIVAVIGFDPNLSDF